MAEEKEKPFTREDLLWAIEQNGGKAEGLDLSGRRFEQGINLRALKLEGIILEDAHLEDAHLEATLVGDYRKEAHFLGTHLEGSNLRGAHLEGADLKFAHLEGADLSYAHLKGADLSYGHLDGAYLAHVEVSPDIKLEHVHWGNYILGEEKDGDFDWAADSYTHLKQWYSSAGMYDIAGQFFFREMTARRKMLKWQSNPFPQAWSKFISVLCGYGEKWHRVIISAAVVVLGLALIYFAIGTLTPNTFLNSLYYSAVSFTALGYGSWAPEPTGWVKGLGAFEAFVGVFMMALFLVTFIRKMTR